MDRSEGCDTGAPTFSYIETPYRSAALGLIPLIVVLDWFKARVSGYPHNESPVNSIPLIGLDSHSYTLPIC